MIDIHNDRASLLMLSTVQQQLQDSASHVTAPAEDIPLPGLKK